MTSALDITYIGHATVLIAMNGIRILTDPVLRDRIGYIRRQAPTVDSALLGDLDAVLVSHMHYDHLDLPSLRMLGRDVRMIVPEGSGDLLWRDGFRHIEELRVGDYTAVGSVSIGATFADHTGSRHPFGPVSDCLGYVLHGSQTVYFAGDTDLFPEMGTMSGRLDLAMLPVWGWGPTLGEGHLDPRRAAESLQLLQPRAAMPIHWGTFAPVGMGWMRPRFLSAPPHTFAAHAGDVAPHVAVHVVQPGAGLRLVH